ncbi:MAG TPA: NUDIX domain-containing protein [Candidatus Saccharimonadales bacterium]|nr:NUDIX domain-containing protein [Candidatus Saccharimonadales bacterium]
MEKIGVIIIVLDEHKQKLLLGKRKNAYKAGYFGLPGGRIELEESLQEAVKRELLEETNLVAEHVTYLGVVRELQETYNFIHFVFLCESYSGELKNNEPDKCEGWEWHLPNELPEDILPGHLAGITIFKNPDGATLRELL